MTLPARWWSLEEGKADGDLSSRAGVLPREPSGQPHAASAIYYARCGLCVHACRIAEGKWGYCGARNFSEGALHSPFLGRFSSIAIDPIEKKPLYHWRPGSAIFSLGSLGCTMRCPFCQNHGIAHPAPEAEQRRLQEIAPENLVALVRQKGLHAIAYTYNEPALQAEYILDAAPLLREAGIATVLVSNGMYSDALLEELCPIVEAANIDLKTFNPDTYAKLGGSLETVKKTISGLHAAGVHVEVTTLVVPGISDSPEEFAEELDWLATLSPDIPLHLSRYRPAYKYTAPPTDVSLLQHFAQIAKDRIKHVHLGNVPGIHLR